MRLESRSHQGFPRAGWTTGAMGTKGVLCFSFLHEADAPAMIAIRPFFFGNMVVERRRVGNDRCQARTLWNQNNGERRESRDRRTNRDLADAVAELAQAIDVALQADADWVRADANWTRALAEYEVALADWSEARAARSRARAAVTKAQAHYEDLTRG
jgi:hypothetical protein